MNYTSILICPVTTEEIDPRDYAYSYGICPHCGHDSQRTFAHAKRVVGSYVPAPFWKRLVFGAKPVFIPKDPVK